MRLILEKLDSGNMHAYIESEKHFRTVEPGRVTPLLESSKLDNECDLSDYPPFHMVFKLAPEKKKK